MAGHLDGKGSLIRADVARFRQRLLAKRQELLADLRELEVEVLLTERAGVAGAESEFWSCLAEAASDNYEQDLALQLLNSERALLRQVDEALQRIEEGVYGACLATGKPISKTRLAARPWARFCIEYARAYERKNHDHRERT